MTPPTMCYKCGKGIADGIALYRQNSKGQQPVWACSVCRELPVPEEVDTLVSLIESTNHVKH